MKKKSSPKSETLDDSKTKTERKGIRAVERYVEDDMWSRWQEFEARNDDGIDGIIMLRKKRLIKKPVAKKKVTKKATKKKVKTAKPKEQFGSIPIRGVLFVQVKGGESYAGESKARNGYKQIQLGEKYIEQHRPRWDALPGPAILVYVDTVNLKQNFDAWWCDLKDPATYSAKNKQIVLVPKLQKFGPHSKGDMRKLVGSAIQYDESLPEFTATTEDLSFIELTESIKVSARRFYRQWAGLPATDRTNPTFGEVLVTRVGWRHITRKKRRTERIIQSLQLLGIAKRIINEVGNIGWLGRIVETPLKNGSVQRRELYGLRAQVSFPFRHKTVVQVILERKRIYGQSLLSDKTWFYSVYEVHRGK